MRGVMTGSKHGSVHRITTPPRTHGGHKEPGRTSSKKERRTELPELTAEDVVWLKAGVGIGNGRYRFQGSQIVIYVKDGTVRFQTRKGCWFAVVFEPETTSLLHAMATLLEYLLSWRNKSEKKQCESRDGVEVRRENTICIRGNSHEIVETLRGLLAPQPDRRRNGLNREPAEEVSETESWTDLRPKRG